jgi:hypothetical protein
VNIEQLKSIFKNLPEVLIDDLVQEEFQSLWYPSSGIDMAPLNIFDPNNPRSILENHNIRLFFYTDCDYLVNLDGALYYQSDEIKDNMVLKSNYQKSAPSKMISSGFNITLIYDSLTKVRLNIFQNNLGLNLYCFFIPLENMKFELFLLKNKLDIFIVCDAGGYGQNKGAIALKNLNVSFTLGDCYSNSDDIEDELIEIYNKQNINILKFSSENIININWGLIGYPNPSASLRKLID